MKQTAVDFLLEELYKLATLSEFLDTSDFMKARTIIYEKAKEMEKEQIIKARQDIFDTGNLTAEQYYEETFKSE